MLIPVLVGLPGAGKSTLAAAVADRLGVGVFQSDPFFRQCRSLSARSSDPRRAIFIAFLERVRREDPDRADAVALDVEALDGDKCVLHDGQLFRQRHGELIFRAFEIEMLAWAQANGVIGSDVPDLSASAPLFEDNRARFSPQHGYLPVLLDVPRRVVVARILADYEAYCAAREDGAPVAIRGGYELELDRAIAPDCDEDMRASALARAAHSITDRFAEERLSRYEDFSVLKFRPRPGALARDIVRDLMAQVADFERQS